MGVLDSGLRLIRRQSLRKGLIGGSRVWMVVGGVYSLLKVVRRMSRATDTVIAAETLKPGESVLIEALPRTSRRDRRRGTAS
ncbi:MAG: hypothetical protein F2934_12085 [Actinobacteria bacterium]|uniref:Unannotated protein n=1 Tax=freshwater metagenome TaxID=449393 RepID=A0A6J7D335_9ZZZZ|nr:hypothetical protein [Actinomycetota bacterium]MSZ03046.1 hypothetical protein [Actinomycetota bacterium]MTB07854.1 hypothetical protein [Actinomycetota bacterium]